MIFATEVMLLLRSMYFYFTNEFIFQCLWVELIFCSFFSYRYTAKFDKVELDKIVVEVSELPDPEVFQFRHDLRYKISPKLLIFLYYICTSIYKLAKLIVSSFQLDPSIKEAFDVAYDNIYAFHFAQKSAENTVENMKASQYYILLLCMYTVSRCTHS